MMPLSLYQNIDKLSFTSFLALLGCFVFTIAVVIYSVLIFIYRCIFIQIMDINM